MRKSFAGLVILFLGAPVFAGGRKSATAYEEQKNSTPECASNAAPKNAGKFTGRIQAAPSGNSFEVTEGKESASVSFSGTTVICQGGQAVSAQSLAPGLAVTVYGAVDHSGKTYRVGAVKIMLEGGVTAAQQARSNSEAGLTKGSNSSNSGSFDSSTRDNNSSASTASSSGVMRTQTGASSPGNEQMTPSGAGNSQNRMQSNSGSNINCEYLGFTVSTPVNPTGQAVGRTQTSGVTCIRAVDQASMQFVTDATRNERLASVDLAWQNSLVAKLTNATVSSVQFTYVGTQEVAEITFQFQRIELSGSGISVLIN